jgi:hypothetical protein
VINNRSSKSSTQFSSTLKKRKMEFKLKRKASLNRNQERIDMKIRLLEGSTLRKCSKRMSQLRHAEKSIEKQGETA